MLIGNFTLTTLLLLIVKILLIFFLGRYIILFMINQIKKILDKKSFDPILEGFALSIIKFLLFFVLIMAILEIIGIKTTSLIAVLGAASLAVGLALQSNLANFASGVIIVSLKPFKIGDYVEIGGESGTIVEIGIFHSTLKTIDNKKILVPNSSVTNNSITNYTAYSERRIDLVISVSYDSNIEFVKNTLKEIVEAHELILADKPVLIRVGEMAESSINFFVRVWTDTDNYWDVFYDLNEQIKTKFGDVGISIPYPHVTIEMKEK